MDSVGPGRKWKERPSPGPAPPPPLPPLLCPERSRTPERGFTRLMGVQVLAGDVVVNHIFFQGGESKPVDWERRERKRARRRLWWPRAAARLTSGLHQLAAPSARPPASPRLSWASVLQPSPWGAPACHCSERTQVPLPLPAPQPLQGSLPVTAAHPPCHPATCRPAPLTDGTCREHEANPAPVPQGPEASSAAQAARTTQKESPPTQRRGRARQPYLMSTGYSREWGNGFGEWG